MANAYKTTHLRSANAAMGGKGKRIESADGSKWAISRFQKRALANHMYDIVECWTLKQRVDGKIVTVSSQRDEDAALDFCGHVAACMWFARCENAATGATWHPVLGNVPTCDRCHKFATGEVR